MASFWAVAAVAILFGSMAVWGIADSWMKHRERRMKLEIKLAAEKNRELAAGKAELEGRVRVLEKIVTDGGVQTAAQIEALREQPRIESGETVR
jgi:uncharacterized membrane protein